MPNGFGENSWLVSYLGAAFASAGFIYISIVWFGKHLSESSLKSLTDWLEGKHSSTWLHHFCALFDTVFGSQHLSKKCFLRSSIASVGAVIGLYIVLSEVLGVVGGRALGDLAFWQVLALGIAINILPDYLSLFETRWLLKVFENTRTVPGQISILLLDLFFSGSIIWISINLFRILSGNPALTLLEMAALFSIFSIFFYSTFFTSAWAWIYCISTWIMKLVSDTALKKVFNVKNEPVRILALINAIVVFAAYLGLAPILRPLDSGRATAFDEFLCSVFDDKVCIHVARFTVDETEAFRHLATACENVGVPYCYKVSLSFFDNDESKVFGLWEKACNGGYDRGCAALGWMYQHGRGTQANMKKALDLYRQICARGSGKGCVQLGWAYEAGNGVKKDAVRAVEFYQISCDAHEEYGCANLGRAYENGFGVATNIDRAFSLYKRACNRVTGKACLFLGGAYERGVGVQKDIEKAITLYKQACSAEEGYGCASLGWALERGVGITKDTRKAVSLYRQSCDAEESMGCNNLGRAYELGIEVEKDAKKAFALYRRACSAGAAIGCNNLGWAYEQGVGVEKDPRRAVLLYMQACEAGAAVGCGNLVRAIEHGVGVKKNP